MFSWAALITTFTMEVDGHKRMYHQISNKWLILHACTHACMHVHTQFLKTTLWVHTGAQR